MFSKSLGEKRTVQVTHAVFIRDPRRLIREIKEVNV